MCVAWDHIDLEGGLLRVRQSNWRLKLLTVKSKASVRDPPPPPVLIEMLKDLSLPVEVQSVGLLFGAVERATKIFLRRSAANSNGKSLTIN